MDGDAVAALESHLGHTFGDRQLLRKALMHRSYAGEVQLTVSYERLEFLGDAVLQLSVTRYLFETFPEMTEGQMAKVRAAVVSENILAEIAREIGVGPAILLGRGEELTGGREKDSLLSDVVEALVGAVFVESGLTTADEIIIRLWSPIIDRRAEAPGKRDYKTRLQEILARIGQRPDYQVEERGPEHAKQFTARVLAGGEQLGEGQGSSKKRAEQAAAMAATSVLDERRKNADA